MYEVLVYNKESKKWKVVFVSNDYQEAFKELQKQLSLKNVSILEHDQKIHCK